MNIAGLNNQSFQAQTKKSDAGKSSQGEKSSFGALLGAEGKEQQRSQVNSESSNSSRRDSRDSAQGRSSQASGQQPQAQNQNQNQTQPQVASPAQTKTQPQAPAQPPREDSAESQSVSETSGLPTSATPSVGAPGLSDRVAAPAVNPAALNAVLNPTATPQAEDANSLTRRVVWNDFLRKMNDLGVSAEDVLHAFGSLSEKDLAQPPEMTVDKVVMALGLDGQQAVMAKQYFNDLIAKTKSHSFGEELAKGSKQISLSLMTQRELQHKALLNSLDRLDKSFFVNPRLNKPEQPQVMIGEDGKPMIVPPSANLNELTGLEARDMTPEMAMSLPSAASPLTEGGAHATQMAAANPNAAALNPLVAQMQQATPADQKSIDQLIKNFNAREMKTAQTPTLQQIAALGPQATGPQAAAPSPGIVTAPAAMAGGGLAALGLTGKGKDTSTGDDASDDSNTGPGSLDKTLMANGHLGAGEAVKGEFQAQMAKSENAQQPMGVPDLLQQAHIMVKDGGGDMKVTLHPDGLGEVALRVSVNDGKVSVAMVTESDEAKKLIERQIGDLKAGLAQNHLAVDTIKVDTATNLGKQLEQQYHDAQRQQAQAALEQFRQEGGGEWRRSFFDVGPVNPYKSQGDAPRDTSAPITRAAARNSSRRLDLVA